MLKLNTRDSFYSFAESKINFELALLKKVEYSRQHRVGPYFADFYFPHNNLILEVDGLDFHNSESQTRHDRLRDKYMNENGYCVIRVTGSIVNKNPSGVINAIRNLSCPLTYFVNSEDDIKNLLIESLNQKI